MKTETANSTEGFSDGTKKLPGQNMLQSYFTRPIRVAGVTLRAWIWMGGSFLSMAILGVVAFLVIEYGRVWNLPGAVLWTSGSLFAVSFLILFLLLMRSLFTSRKQFTIFTLLLSAIAFFVNGTVLNHEVFPPLTLRTIVALWVTFAALALTLIEERLPVVIRMALLPFLTFGALLCVAFILVLVPFLPFSWILIWAGGLGFLPYAPLFAMLGFLLSLVHMYRNISSGRRTLLFSRSLIGITLLTSIAYSAYYKLEWDHAIDVLRKPDIEIGHNRIDGDLPSWVRKAARFPVNHVTEMVLQPNRSMDFALFGLQSLFDPLAFLSSVNFSILHTQERNISFEESGKMLHLLFGRSFAHLNRLWDGKSLITTDIDSHVQLYPHLRLAYTETTLSVFNESRERGTVLGFDGVIRYTPEEAIYTIRVPEGSICTKLSLWIDGQEQPARLTFPEKARKAYRTIVGMERRDPSYIEWLDGNRLRLRIFPVNPDQYRTVRIGIVSPLRVESGQLHYDRIALDGPDDLASQKVQVDLFHKSPLDLESSGIWLSEKVVPDGQVRQFTGSFASSSWSLSLPSVDVQGEITAAGESYRVGPMETEKRPLAPEAILVALNDSLSRNQWKSSIKQLYQFHTNVYLLTDEWFLSSDPERAMEYLDQCHLPSFNLFPMDFPARHHLKKVLWVVSGEKHSIPLGELRDSERFTNTMLHGSNEIQPVAILNGRRSEYLDSLIDLHRLAVVSSSEESMVKILNNQSIELPVETDVTIPLPSAKISLHRIHTSVQRKPGSDLLIRLALHRRIMKALGRRFFYRDLENGDLLQLARQGMMVSPVSTLIVLETENDYRRFGIESEPSSMGESKLEAPGGSPEPHEIALALFALFSLLSFFYLRRRATHAL